MTEKLNLSPTLVSHGKQPGKYYDDSRTGLFLHIRKSGSKQWYQRYSFHGKRRVIGLGKPPSTSLSQARAIAIANQETLASGTDPHAEKRKNKHILSFEDLALKRFEEQAPTWRNSKHRDQWISTLRRYAFDRIGHLPIKDITPLDIKGVLMPIWMEKQETARRVKQRLSDVMRYAVALGMREDDPVAAISAALPKQSSKRNHHRSTSYEEVGAVIKVVRESMAYDFTKLAFEFLVLTASRSGEVRGATWDEIDLDNALWTIPAERMKAGNAHRVPLSDRALIILNEALMKRRNDLVFPSPFDKVLSDSTLSKLLRELGIDAVPHGFRTSFRVWIQEQTNTPDRVAELCLAHTDRNQVQAAYARSDMIEKRVMVMQLWADYISDRIQPNVITMIDKAS